MKLKSLLNEFGPGYSPQYPGGSKKSVSQMAMSISNIEKKAWQAGIAVENKWDEWADDFLESRGVQYWGDLKEDDLQTAYSEALQLAKELKLPVVETVLTEAEAPLYKDWKEFVNPDYIEVYLNDGRKLQISKRHISGGTRIYQAIVQAFNDDRTDITNKVVGAMSSMMGGTLKSEGYGEIPLMQTFKVSDDALNKSAALLKKEKEFANVVSSNELSQKLKSTFDKMHNGLVKFSNPEVENVIKWAVSRMQDTRYHNEIERLFTAMESINEAVDTGAYRRLVITSPKHKEIKAGAEKFMEQYAYLYPDLTFNVIESPKPNTIVIDLIGNKATVVGIKFEDLAKKLDKTSQVVVRKEKKLGK